MKIKVITTVILSIFCISSFAQNADLSSEQEAALKNIMTRVSVRKFQNKPIEAEKVDKLLRAGMAAPTANDKQPWHFVVLNDAETINRYAESNARHADDIRNTPLFIFVCGDNTRMNEGQGRDFWIEDTSAASENILLAAHAMGLGAVWTSIYPIQKKVEGISRTLKLPENLIPMCAICIGYPAETPQVKNKWDENKITYGIPQ